MPFLGITDNVQPKLQRLGKFRKGGEKQPGSNRPGPELDHWRITATDPAVQQACNEIFGLAPKSVLVFLPYPETSMNFSVDGEIWDAGGLVHRCDGKIMSVWREDVKMPNGKIKTIYQRGQKPCTGGHIDDDPKRNLVGRLTFIPAIRNPNSGADGIPYIPGLALRGYPGAFSMETHSINDCLNILGTLSGIAATVDRNGQPIAFELYRFPQEISTPKFDGTAGRSRATKHLVGIRVAPEWYAEQFGGQILALGDAYRESLGAGAYAQPALPAPQTNALPAGSSHNYAAPANTPAPAATTATPPKPKKPVDMSKRPVDHENYKFADEPAEEMFVKPSERINTLGNKLWPGRWEAAKKKLIDNGITAEESQLNALENRFKSITTEYPKTETLEKHLIGTWPGAETIVIELAGKLAESGIEWNPLEIIRAVAGNYVENDPDNHAGLAGKVVAALTTIAAV